MIDVLNFKDFNLNATLSNIVLGHHRDKEKLLIEQFKTTIVTTDELNSFSDHGDGTQRTGEDICLRARR